jgi:predicted Zn finger-like uncharacterized protein
MARDLAAHPASVFALDRPVLAREPATAYKKTDILFLRDAMIISCSACTTRYLVDPALIGPDGREVRCAKCGHQWVQTPPEDAPDQPPLPPLEPGIRSIPEEQVAGASSAAANLPAVAKRTGRRSSGLAWALLLLLIAVLAVGFVARNDIMAAWPPSARLYERLGLAAPSYDTVLAVRNGTSSYQQEDGKPVLVVQGEVVNISSALQTVPKLRASLRDNGREVQSWIFQATQSRLLPGESASFVTRFKGPSPSATDLTISFTDEQ